MRRDRVLQAVVSATLLSMPAFSPGQPTSASFIGPMGVGSFSGLPSWSVSSNWSSGQIPGITSNVGVAVLGNVNQPSNSNLPYGGFLGIVQNQSSITLSTIDIYNNILGANIYSPSGGATTIDFSGAGTINVPATLTHSPLLTSSWLDDSIFTNLAGTSGLTINGGGGGVVWLGGNNSGLSGGLTINGATVWLIEQPGGTVDPYGQATGAITDSLLGASNSTVTLNAATISLYSAGSGSNEEGAPTQYNSTDDYVIGSGGGTLDTGYEFEPVYTGIFSGSGTLSIDGNIALNFSGTSSFNGPLHVYGDATASIGPAASFANVTQVYDESVLYLNNSGSGTVVNKFSSSTQFTLAGGQIVVQGNSVHGYNESVGTKLAQRLAQHDRPGAAERHRLLRSRLCPGRHRHRGPERGAPGRKRQLFLCHWPGQFPHRRRRLVQLRARWWDAVIQHPGQHHSVDHRIRLYQCRRGLARL
jgi:hypothetical protein